MIHVDAKVLQRSHSELKLKLLRTDVYHTGACSNGGKAVRETRIVDLLLLRFKKLAATAR